jgi:carbonic anhydrase
MEFSQILENNRTWVAERTADDPHFFARLAAEHRPQFLFIGCSDARVPANVITQTAAGEMFVHRNIANLVVPTDTNLLAVLQYAVEVLKVRDVIVCGHEGCGGVRAAMGPAAPPLVENWVANIRAVARLHDAELSEIEDADRRFARLVELNVIEQVCNLSRTPVVQSAWSAGATLRLHGVVYRLEHGLLRDIGVTLDGSPDGAVAGVESERSAVGGGRSERARRRTPAATLRDGVLRLG